MIKKFKIFEEKFYSDKIIWKDLPPRKFKVGDTVELIGPAEAGFGSGQAMIGLQGIIIPVQLSIEPNPDHYAAPLSVTEADYHSYKGKISYNVKTRWPDPTGSHYEFWKKQKEKEEINPHPDYLKRREEINPMTFFEIRVAEDNLKKIDKREYLKGLVEYRKRIENKLREKGLRREEIAKLMKDIDPYGEEDWGDDLKEEADYRNVTGNGSMGNNDPQNAGPSFNRGPDSATFCRPDVVGLVGDDIEDPYFGDRRRLKMRRIKKNKHIESNRKKKTKYFRDLDRDTLRNKIVEQVVHVAAGAEERYQKMNQQLEKIRKMLPEARLEVVGRAGGLPAWWEIVCGYKDYLNLGDDKAAFAPNAFDSLENLSDAIDDIIENGGNNIEVGSIEIDDYDDKGNPTFLSADTLYFDNIERSRLQPVGEEDVEDNEMEPFWSVPSPDEIDGGPMIPEELGSKRWYGRPDMDPYGEEDWNDEQEMWSWRAWWD